MRTLDGLMLCGIVFAGVASAQTYPSRPIRVVVPFPAGGGSDTMGRLVAQKLTEGLKQQAYVDNRGGAGGRVGTEHAARSAPDGYTLLLVGSGAIIMAPALYRKLPYDVQRDFAPIGSVAASSYVLALHPAVPAQSMRQLIALCKAKPAALNYASSGLGAPGHLTGELFQSMAQVKMVHIPYKGTSPALMAVIGGESDLIFSNILPAVPAVQSRRLRAIGITSLRRSSILPQVPTIAESGLPGFESETRYGVLAPAGTPREIVMRVNAALVKGLQSADTRKSMEADGSEVVTSTPEEFADFIKRDTERWARVIKSAGIKPE